MLPAAFAGLFTLMMVVVMALVVWMDRYTVPFLLVKNTPIPRPTGWLGESDMTSKLS